MQQMINVFSDQSPDFSKDFYEMPFPCIDHEKIGDFSKFHDLYMKIISIQDVNFFSINGEPYGLDTRFAEYLEDVNYDSNLLNTNFAITLEDIIQAYNNEGEEIRKILFFDETRYINDSLTLHIYNKLINCILYLLIKDLFYCFPQDDIILQFRKMHYGMEMDLCNELVARILFIESMMGEQIAELLISSGRMDGAMFNEAMDSLFPASKEYDMPFVQIVEKIRSYSYNNNEIICILVCDVIKDCFEFYKNSIVKNKRKIYGFRDSYNEEIALHMHDYAIINYGEEGTKIHKI